MKCGKFRLRLQWLGGCVGLLNSCQDFASCPLLYGAAFPVGFLGVCQKLTLLDSLPHSDRAEAALDLNGQYLPGVLRVEALLWRRAADILLLGGCLLNVQASAGEIQADPAENIALLQGFVLGGAQQRIRQADTFIHAAVREQNAQRCLQFGGNFSEVDAPQKAAEESKEQQKCQPANENAGSCKKSLHPVSRAAAGHDLESAVIFPGQRQKSGTVGAEGNAGIPVSTGKDASEMHPAQGSDAQKFPAVVPADFEAEGIGCPEFSFHRQGPPTCF